MAVIRIADEAAIAKAAKLIRSGKLVAFPTETVYGLGANALDPEAVASIFAAKGRPPSNPVIVHVADAAAARHVAEVNDTAERLMTAFWPGPLTLVLPKLPVVPGVVTAGGPTVAVRMPRHRVALALLTACGLPIAAPSANRSEGLSPTLASHVASGLGGSVDLILDGGPCDVGIESTVLDVTVSPPRVLRPGMVTPAMIADTLGISVGARQRALDIADIDVPAPGAPGASPAGLTPTRSPGQMARHYAPRTPLCLVDDVWQAAHDAAGAIGVVAITPTPSGLRPGITVVSMASDPAPYATRLYPALHELDSAGVTVILVEMVPASEGWDAIRDRLARASASG